MTDEERSMEMDELTAHLDRGWDLLSRGDLAGARVSADHILQIDGESPEGYTLLGAIANAEGDAEEAFELLRRALDLDPEYVDAMIYGAELAVNWLDDPETALRLCDEAEELVEPDDEEMIDIAILRGEAQLALGAVDDLLRTTRPLAARQLDAGHMLRLGRLLAEAGQADLAVPMLRRCIEGGLGDGDPHYFLASALEQQGNAAQALEHFFRARQLDGERVPPPWLPDLEGIAEIAREQIGRLEGPLGDALKDALVRVEELPALELIAEGVDPRASVFVAVQWGEGEGDRRGGRGGGGRNDPQIVAVFFYRRNLERTVGSAPGLADEMRQALGQETAAVLGLGEGQDPAG